MQTSPGLSMKRFYLTTCGRCGTYWLAGMLNDLRVPVSERDRQFRHGFAHPGQWRRLAPAHESFWTHWLTGDLLRWMDRDYLWWKDVGLPVVSQFRDPRDVAISVYHLKRNHVAIDYELQDVIYQVKMIFEATNTRKLFQDPDVYKLRYEDLLADTAQSIKRLLSHLSAQADEREIEEVAHKHSFENLSGRKRGADTVAGPHNRHPDSLRKGVIGDWKNYDADWPILDGAATYYGYDPA